MPEPTEEDISRAWYRAAPISGQDPERYRLAPDLIQAVIRRDRHNKCGKYGWRIECGKPVSFHRLSMSAAMRRVGRDLSRKPSKPAVAS
jgi:hypothetical protein